MSLDKHALFFRVYGEYYFFSRCGFYKSLIIDDFTSLSAAIKIFEFIGKNIVHSNADRWLCYPEIGTDIFLASDVVRKFFYTDQPLMIHCNENATFMGFIFQSLGFNVRKIWVCNAESKNGHVFIEVFIAEIDKWVMFDGDYGVIVRDSHGRYLSTEEISKSNIDSLVVNGINQKRWLKEEYNLNSDFFGALAWTEEMRGKKFTADEGEYKKMINKCFQEGYTYDFYIDDMNISAVNKSRYF